jgi:hypothetical protein
MQCIPGALGNKWGMQAGNQWGMQASEAVASEFATLVSEGDVQSISETQNEARCRHTRLLAITSK